MTFTSRYLTSRHLTSLVLPLFICWIASAEPATANAEAPAAPKSAERPRLMLISWDGAGDVLIDRLLAEGKLPHLAALADRGARAEHMIGTWPTKTAPSHASIYTGCGVGTHGVTANSTLYWDDPSAHSVLDKRRGFSSFALTAEPFFVTTALEGLSTLVLGATHYHPHSPIAERFENRKDSGQEIRYRSVSSFEHRILDSGTVAGGDLRPAGDGWSDVPGLRGEPREWTLEAADDTLFGLVFDAADDPTDGLDTVLIRIGSRSNTEGQSRLKPRQAGEAPTGWSRPFLVHDGAHRGLLYFRLFQLAADGSEMVLYRREVNPPLGAISEADLDALFQSGPVSYDDVVRTYSRGRLGRPLMIGGDGTAEARLLEAIAFDVEQLTANTVLAWRTWNPQVLFHYSPHLDQLGHEWLAALHPDSSAYKREVAERLWPVYGQVAAQLDRWLGKMMELGGDDTVIALVSDHGMAYSTRDVAINRILEDAGLLARGEDGRIDLSRTKILAAEASFYLRVNGVKRRGGIVTDAERSEVIRQAATALLSARDPETGSAVISQVFTADSLSHLGLGERGGDLYFDTVPGYYPGTRFPKEIVAPTRRSWGGGTHGHWRHRRDMHAIFYLAGPGVKPGTALPPVSQIDVAPTLAALIGVRPPADACGRVVHEVSSWGAASK